MDSFKSHIYQKQPGSQSESRELPTEESVSISFSEQLPTLKQAEQLLIAEALDRANGNQSIAAPMLGISRQALNKRLKKDSQ